MGTCLCREQENLQDKDDRSEKQPAQHRLYPNLEEAATDMEVGKPRRFDEFLEKTEERGESYDVYKEFMQYLQDHNQELMLSLRFLVETEKLRILEVEKKKANPARVKQINELELKVLRAMGEKYFDVTQDDSLSMQNQVLFEEASSLLPSLAPEKLQAGLDLIAKIRYDPLVWDEVDKEYRKFLAATI